jgi:hypothetical protein
MAKSSGITITPVDVLRAPTIRAQAALLDRMRADGRGEAEVGQADGNP